MLNEGSSASVVPALDLSFQNLSAFNNTTEVQFEQGIRKEGSTFGQQVSPQHSSIERLIDQTESVIKVQEKPMPPAKIEDQHLYSLSRTSSRKEHAALAEADRPGSKDQQASEILQTVSYQHKDQEPNGNRKHKYSKFIVKENNQLTLVDGTLTPNGDSENNKRIQFIQNEEYFQEDIDHIMAQNSHRHGAQTGTTTALNGNRENAKGAGDRPAAHEQLELAKAASRRCLSIDDFEEQKRSIEQS